MTIRETLSTLDLLAAPLQGSVRLLCTYPGHTTCIFRVDHENSSSAVLIFSYTLFLDIAPVMTACRIRMATDEENLVFAASIRPPLTQYIEPPLADTQFGLSAGRVIIEAERRTYSIWASRLDIETAATASNEADKVLRMSAKRPLWTGGPTLQSFDFDAE
jgi:hypothetical protein